MEGLIFSGASRAYLKISKRRLRAQKWRLRLNEGAFCDSVHAGL